MKKIYLGIILINIHFGCDNFKTGDSSKTAPRVDSSESYFANYISDTIIDDSVIYFQNLNDVKKDEFVLYNISNEIVLNFWLNRDIQMNNDFYYSVISNFDKTGKHFDFYFYCIEIIEKKIPSFDGYFFEIIQRYYEYVYDLNKYELFQYLRWLEKIGDTAKVDDILNSIGFSFQSIIQDDPDYFQDLIKEDPLNEGFYKRIEKFALENI